METVVQLTEWFVFITRTLETMDLKLALKAEKQTIICLRIKAKERLEGGDKSLVRKTSY